MKKLLEVYYFGYGILISAAVINWSGNFLGLKSWYDLFGAVDLNDLSLANIFWLFAAYPFLLGASIYILNKYKAKVIK